MSARAQRELALEITRKLRDSGYEAFWAGGCVRDQLLGREPKDYDVATNARPEEVQSLFGKRRTLAIGAAFGVIAVLGKDSSPVEVATFRTDCEYLDGRRPSAVTFTTAEHDAQRRDFTINGMFFDPINDRVIDFIGGQADLQAGIIRAIGDPRARFAEDKLRMLRAVRFATTLEFEIEPATLNAIRVMAAEIEIVSAERIGVELTRLLVHPRRATGMLILERAGLLKPLLPTLADKAVNSTNDWKNILQNLQKLDSENISTVWAVLFGEESNGTHAAEVGRRFRFANREIELAVWLTSNLPLVARATEIGWPRLQRVLIHEGVAELMALARVMLGPEHAGVRRCLDCLALPPRTLNPPLLITGDDLIKHGLKPGPHFGPLLTVIRDAQLEGRINSQTEALELAEELSRDQA